MRAEAGGVDARRARDKRGAADVEPVAVDFEARLDAVPVGVGAAQGADLCAVGVDVRDGVIGGPLGERGGERSEEG